MALPLAVAAGLVIAMSLAWVIQQRSGNSVWVDVSWTAATGAAGLAFALGARVPPAARQVLMAALILAWALRLGLHLLARARGGHEDPRYAALKAEWGARARLMMFGFLQVQAIAAWLLGLSVYAAASNPAPANYWDLLGLAILAVGIAGEGIADRQLRRFRADPSTDGRVCDVGLWSWSRHPNYFFQWFGWLAYPCFAAGPNPLWPLAWLAPALMYLLLVHGSGIPPLERHMLARRPAAYRAYQRRTSAFFPRPPRLDARRAEVSTR
jgi:steroid 5-alpha reductase family enzyme